MKYRVVVNDEVWIAIRQASIYYDSVRAGFGQELELEVDLLLKDLQVHPQMYPVVLATVRRALIRRFKQHLYYSIEGEAVVVIEFRDGRRQPPPWLSQNNP